jgi:hypothetical protein
MRKLAGSLAGMLAVGVALMYFGGGALAAGPDLVITGPGSGTPNVRTFAGDGTASKSFLSIGENGATVA